MKITDSPYSIAPRDDPRVYPGAIPPFSYVFAGDKIFPFDELSLARFLSQRGSAPLENRIPVLAIGSNANPAQLQRKFGNEAVIPVLKARVSNLDAVYSCHMSGYGAVPATFIAAQGIETALHITFLDEGQLAIMDQTEDVNYDRVRLDGARFPVTLEDTLPQCEAYQSRWGALVLGDSVFRLTSVAGGGTPFPPATEIEILERLIKQWNADFPDEKFASPDDLLQKRNPGLIERIKTWMYPQYATFDTRDDT